MNPLSHYPGRARDSNELSLLPVLEPPLELPRAIRVGVVNNPRAGRNLARRKFRRILELLGEHRDVRHFEVFDEAGIHDAVDMLLRDGVELLAVNGGDGTVQAVLTCLFRRRTTGFFPLLLVLPGGTTNMTAGDVGSRGDPASVLRKVLEDARLGRLPGRLEHRPVLRLLSADRRLDLYGMYFAAGAIYHGIRFCREWIQRAGARGETGPGITLALVLGQILFGPRGSLIPPLRMSGEVDGETIEEGDFLGVQVTTLRRLLFGLRPFWGEGPAPLRFTAIRYAPQHALRVVLPIMRGRPNSFVTRENGYLSANARCVRLEFEGGFALDGELFESRKGVPLDLVNGVTAPFYRLPVR
ncbi:MAG: diacylglycerol kinase [Candidatus Binatia bacterium]|nr:MAG: diacylglycerol kinase [Candidatus Binatia bacterium]